MQAQRPERWLTKPQFFKDRCYVSCGERHYSVGWHIRPGIRGVQPRDRLPAKKRVTYRSASAIARERPTFERQCFARRFPAANPKPISVNSLRIALVFTTPSRVSIS